MFGSFFSKSKPQENPPDSKDKPKAPLAPATTKASMKTRFKDWWGKDEEEPEEITKKQPK
jgi:hypothetical protein